MLFRCVICDNQAFIVLNCLYLEMQAMIVSVFWNCKISNSKMFNSNSFWNSYHILTLCVLRRLFLPLTERILSLKFSLLRMSDECFHQSENNINYVVLVKVQRRIRALKSRVFTCISTIQSNIAHFSCALIPNSISDLWYEHYSHEINN